jgi:hypothetical protein
MSLRHTIRIAFAWACLMLPLQGFAAIPDAPPVERGVE